MDITIDNTGKQFVIRDRGCVSYMGFDVVFAQACEMVHRLKRAGYSFLAPTTDGIGSMAQFELFRKVQAAYLSIGDRATWFDSRTPTEVRNTLERARRTRIPIRVFYGDSATGRDWLEEFDTQGYVGRSSGAQKVPLLVAPNELGGGAMLTHCIVRVVDTAANKELYRHPNYHLPLMKIKTATPDLVATGLRCSVFYEGPGKGLICACNMKSLADAAHWVAYMSGNINTPLSV